MTDPEVVLFLASSEQCCSEHEGVDVSLGTCFHFLQVRTQKWEHHDILEHFSVPQGDALDLQHSQSHPVSSGSNPTPLQLISA